MGATQEGQYTDRYTKAVDQLGQQGPEKLQIRLGGIYALERLARDSPRDQPTIVEILSAFIRTTTPQPSSDSADALKVITTCTNQSVAPDIQAALTVLGRRDTTHDQNSRIDLIGTCLNNANLGGAKINEANLYGAHLNGANLRDVYLNGANLNGAYLSGANLRGAQLNGANLNSANLSGASLFAANLGGANLNDAKLDGADLRDADLSRTSR